MFEALLLLFIKHFICDFPLQTSPWMYENKGQYLHLGGITHAAIHAVGTWLILFFFIGADAWSFALLDFIIHYHIDWAKVSLNNRFNYQPNHNGFWFLLGLDQLLHHLTYFLIIYYAFDLSIT